MSEQQAAQPEVPGQQPARLEVPGHHAAWPEGLEQGCAAIASKEDSYLAGMACPVPSSNCGRGWLCIIHIRNELFLLI